MRQILHIPAAALLILAALSCSTDDINELDKKEEKGYIGTVSVEYNGETYDNPNIKVSYTPSVDGRTANLKIFKIKFVPQMPVRVNVTIPGIQVWQEESITRFYVDDINPLSLGGEFPKYRVTDMNGSISGNEINFSLNFGEYPTRYSGACVL